MLWLAICLEFRGHNAIFESATPSRQCLLAYSKVMLSTYKASQGLAREIRKWYSVL